MGADFAQNPNRFKPAMPQIPGVSVPKPPAEETAGPRRWKLALRIAVPLAGALAVGAVVAWWTLGRLRATAKSPAPEVETQHVSAPAPEGSARVATLAELARPWSAKRFFLHKRFTNELVVAIVVRLPGGAANRSASYWAFSLQAPYGRCELEYVTDLAKLKSQYGYRAHYPMVADPCNRILYDPLHMGSVPGGAWARGEVVHGGGIRPPMGIGVRVQGDHLIAGQIE